MISDLPEPRKVPIVAPSVMEQNGTSEAVRDHKRRIAKQAEHHVASLLPGSRLVCPDWNDDGTPDPGWDIEWSNDRKAYRIDVKWVPDGAKYAPHAGANFRFDVVVVVSGQPGSFSLMGAALPDQFRPADESGGLCPTGRFVWLRELLPFPADWPIASVATCAWSITDGIWRCSTHPDERWDADALQITTVPGEPHTTKPRDATRCYTCGAEAKRQFDDGSPAFDCSHIDGATTHIERESQWDISHLRAPLRCERVGDRCLSHPDEWFDATTGVWRVGR
jgi:hypothetical protein